MMSILIVDLKIINETKKPVASLSEFLQMQEKPAAVFIDSHEDIENIKKAVIDLYLERKWNILLYKEP